MAIRVNRRYTEGQLRYTERAIAALNKDPQTSCSLCT